MPTSCPGCKTLPGEKAIGHERPREEQKEEEEEEGQKFGKSRVRSRKRRDVPEKRKIFFIRYTKLYYYTLKSRTRGQPVRALKLRRCGQRSVELPGDSMTSQQKKNF